MCVKQLLHDVIGPCSNAAPLLAVLATACTDWSASGAAGAQPPPAVVKSVFTSLLDGSACRAFAAALVQHTFVREFVACMASESDALTAEEVASMAHLCVQHFSLLSTCAAMSAVLVGADASYTACMPQCVAEALATVARSVGLAAAAHTAAHCVWLPALYNAAMQLAATDTTAATWQRVSVRSVSCVRVGASRAIDVTALPSRCRFTAMRRSAALCVTSPCCCAAELRRFAHCEDCSVTVAVDCPGR
jgi:hypothetical protein